MCGVIGVFGKIPSEEKCRLGVSSLSHRGPDDHGLYYNGKEGIALGHTRLSIIDLSKDGRQPFEDEHYIISFNGEIYNYQEIKDEIGDRYTFRTETDTEVLLASFALWGSECLKKLNGMFSFVIYDKKDGDVFIARDRLGIKPFFYALHEGALYVASEIKAILALADIPRILNKQSVLDYFSYRYPLDNETMFEQIQCLPAAHYATFSAVNPQISPVRYWDLSTGAKREDLSFEDVIRETEEHIDSSLKYRMIADVPLGAYLSGGLDSSLLVAKMAKLSSKPVKTFSIGFDHEGYDEHEFAQIVSEQYGTDHTQLVMQDDEYISLIPEVIQYRDAPLSIPNEVAVHVLSKELKKHISVVLSGEGADELFGGYGRIFRSGDDFERMKDMDAYSEEEKDQLLQNLQEKYDMDVESLAEHFVEQYSYIASDDKAQILDTDTFDGHDFMNQTFFDDEFRLLSSMKPSEQIMHVFQRIHLLGPLYRLDATTMSSAVEARVPYVDHELVEFVSSLPIAYKMRFNSDADEHSAQVLNSDQISEIKDTTKYLLREIAKKYLPKKITSRTKKGFPVPLNEWFQKKKNRGKLKEMIFSEDSRSRQLYNQSELRKWLDDDSVSGRRGYNLWMIMNLEIWMRLYNVSI